MIDSEFFGQAAQQRVEFLTIGLGVCSGFVLLMVRGWPVGLALALGAGAAWLDFRWMRRLVQSITSVSLLQAREGKRKPRLQKRVFLQILGRYALLGLILYAMLLRFYWPALAFLCGLFALVAAVLLEVIGELVLGRRRSMLT